MCVRANHNKRTLGVFGGTSTFSIFIFDLPAALKSNSNLVPLEPIRYLGTFEKG